jgi:hypothetical protein
MDASGIGSVELNCTLLYPKVILTCSPFSFSRMNSPVGSLLVIVSLLANMRYYKPTREKHSGWALGISIIFIFIYL